LDGQVTNLEHIDDGDDGAPSGKHKHPMPAPEKCSCEYGIHCGEECSQPSCLCQGWHPSSEAKEERPRETRQEGLDIAHSSAIPCVGWRGVVPVAHTGQPAGWWLVAPGRRNRAGSKWEGSSQIGSERLTELAENTTTPVRKRVICARCDCSLVRHWRLLFWGSDGARHGAGG